MIMRILKIFVWSSLPCQVHPWSWCQHCRVCAHASGCSCCSKGRATWIRMIMLLMMNMTWPASPANLKVDKRPDWSLGRACKASKAPSDETRLASKVAKWDIQTHYSGPKKHQSRLDCCQKPGEKDGKYFSILQLCFPPLPPPPSLSPGLINGLKAVVSVSTVSGLQVKRRRKSLLTTFLVFVGSGGNDIISADRSYSSYHVPLQVLVRNFPFHPNHFLGCHPILPSTTSTKA